MLLAPELTASAPVAAAGEVSVTVIAPDRVVPGSNFTATVNISQVVDLNAVQYDISFNPSVLRLNGVTPGKVDSTAMPVQSMEVSPGKYGVVQFLGFNKISGAGYLAVLHFSVVGSAGGSGTINLANGILSNWQAQEIPATWNGDTVSISSAESPGGGLTTPTTVPSSPPETSGAVAAEGSISESGVNEGSGNASAAVSAEFGGEGVTAAIAPSSKTAAPRPTGTMASAEAVATSSSQETFPTSPEIALAKPVIWPVLWGATVGVLVVGLVIFLEVRRRAYLRKQFPGDKTNQS
ncbi:MAG: hypothetical protein HY663_02210 [Chloroflexi bacterium]|nr:hypothetical protein [Chloroflexota bacterium]